MPRDFGDWFGDTKPLTFNDPTPEAPKAKRDPASVPYKGPTPQSPAYNLRPETQVEKMRREAWENVKAAPVVRKEIGFPEMYLTQPRDPGKSTHSAIAALLMKGFTYDFNGECMRHNCARCLREIRVPLREAHAYAGSSRRLVMPLDLCMLCAAKKA